MSTVGCDLDKVRDRFPAWVFFRSDAGAFYATRRGERLSFGDRNRASTDGLR
ncbi:hypothetical protein ACQP1V_35575 [Microtetraspora malaysiensis]|uniref:hypothetical protein n=1 Tax=Microtetraspora malaysiensis TaxID=161358 RepID=UPI003D8BBADD